MELNEPIIRTGHPPHPGWYKMAGVALLRFLRRVFFFLLIFVFTFHFPYFDSTDLSRQESIKEILTVLEKHPTGLANAMKEELAEIIYEESTRYNHDPKFIMAVIYTESEFYNWAVSSRGAKGLMQIMPEVGEYLSQEMGIEWSGDRTLFDPSLNIRMGIYYLSRLILDFDDVRLALTAYNYGPTHVRGLIENKQNIPANYYRKIFTVYQNL
jgi:soluble lytic murein transglycosylase